MTARIKMSSTDVTTSASLPDPIKAAIIEDQRTIREGLAALIGGTEGFRCTGSYGSMEEALKKISVGVHPNFSQAGAQDGGHGDVGRQRVVFVKSGELELVWHHNQAPQYAAGSSMI
jgi:hypothetical protein